MKRKAIYIVLLLFLNQLHLFSQEYFVEHISSLKVFYESKLVDLQPIEDFCDENDYSKYFEFYHDRYTDRYYILVQSDDYKFFLLFEVEKGHVSNIPKYKISISEDSMFCGIYNGQVLFWFITSVFQNNFLIYNLLNDTEKIIYNIKETALKPIGFNEKRIFFPRGYYDLNRQVYIHYKPKFVGLPAIDTTGDRLIGLNTKGYLIIYDLNKTAVTITKTGIKRGELRGKYNSTGLYSLNGDLLYFSMPNDLHLFDWMFCSNYEKRKWYKMDLTTGKITRIKQPTGYVEIY